MQSRLESFKQKTKKFIYKSFTSLVLTVYFCFALILLLLLFFVLLGLYLSLRSTTNNEIRQTLSKQADDNMLALSSQGAAALWTHFFQVRDLLRLSGEVVVSMQNEDTFALKVIQSVSLQDACKTKPCLNRFAYQTYSSTYNQDWLDKTSRLEPMVKLIVDNTLVPLGLSIHFTDWGFSRYMPPELGLESDSTAETNWLNEWKSRRSVNNTLVSTLVSSMDFSLTPPQATLMQDLVLSGKSVGVLSARLGVESDLRHASTDLLYLGKGFVMTIYRNGIAVREDLKPTTISELGFDEEWALLLENPYIYSDTTHDVVYQGELYRMAAHPTGEFLSENSDNWWFVTALLVKEADILDLENYNYATDMALWMLVYPMLAALFILIIGAVLNWCLNNTKLRTPMNRIAEAMAAMKAGKREEAKLLLETLGKDLHKSEVQRLVLGMYRLINEVNERSNTGVASESSID